MLQAPAAAPSTSGASTRHTSHIWQQLETSCPVDVAVLGLPYCSASVSFARQVRILVQSDAVGRPDARFRLLSYDWSFLFYDELPARGDQVHLDFIPGHRHLAEKTYLSALHALEEYFVRCATVSIGAGAANAVVLLYTS